MACNPRRREPPDHIDSRPPAAQVSIGIPVPYTITPTSVRITSSGVHSTSKIGMSSLKRVAELFETGMLSVSLIRD